MTFKEENKILIWAPFQMKADKWDKFSIPLLCRKMLMDFKRLGVNAIVPLPKTHEELKDTYFAGLGDGPGTIDFVSVDVTYLNGDLRVLDFKELTKRSDFKMVLNTEPFQSKTLKTALSKPAAFFEPTVVNYVLFSPDENLFTEDQKLHVVLSLLLGKTIFNGPASREQTAKIARDNFSPTLVRKAMESGWKVNSLGINCNKIDDIRSRTDKRPNDGVVRFLYGGRLSHHKHVEDTIDAVKFLYESGMNVQYTIQTYGQNSCKKLEEWAKQYPFIKPLYNVPQEDFYKNALTHDIFICASRLETYGLSFFEMLYCGMIGIFVKQPWQKNIIPSTYQLMVDNKKEMMDLAKKAASNLEGYRQYVTSYPGWIRDNENSSNKNEELLGILTAWATEKK